MTGIMRNDETFLSINLKSWVYGTIKKVEQGKNWNASWQETYQELGGTSQESGRKGCPMNGTKTLYRLGRIKGTTVPFEEISIQEIANEYSKNGAYALLAIEQLTQDPHLSLHHMWMKIQQRYREETKDEPALSNQGGPTIAYKLWHLGLIADK